MFYCGKISRRRKTFAPPIFCFSGQLIEADMKVKFFKNETGTKFY